MIFWRCDYNKLLFTKKCLFDASILGIIRILWHYYSNIILYVTLHARIVLEPYFWFCLIQWCIIRLFCIQSKYDENIYSFDEPVFSLVSKTLLFTKFTAFLTLALFVTKPISVNYKLDYCAFGIMYQIDEFGSKEYSRWEVMHEMSKR